MSAEPLLRLPFNRVYIRLEADGKNIEEVVDALRKALEGLDTNLVDRSKRYDQKLKTKYATSLKTFFAGTARATYQFTTKPSVWLPNRYGLPPK